MSLSDVEREELRESARRLLVDRSSSERVRALVDDPRGFDEDLWSQVAELGWLAIHLPEDVGGMGGSFADLAIILHELGRQLAMIPMLSSVVLGGSALMAASNRDLAAELIPDLAAGTRRATFASSNRVGAYDPARSDVRWRSADGRIELSGAAHFVPDAHLADVLVVVALDEDGSACVVAVDPGASGVRVESTPTVDQTRRLATVAFDGASVADDRLLVDPGEPARELIERINAVGAVAVGCDSLGAAEQMLERSTSYAREREQFGRPIGSFQAVKHHCANMLVAVESSRALVEQAAETFDAAHELQISASAVSSYAVPSCADVCMLAVQVHGGIGFTWEHDAHMFLKRLKLNEALFGRAAWHRRRLAALALADST